MAETASVPLMHIEEMEEEAWDLRETFAHFGRAFYYASVLEVGLAHVLLFADFLHGVHEQYKQTKGVGFDRARYETEFDAFMEKQFAQTMGNVIRKVEKLPEITPELRDRIADAKTRRDFLTHHYWRERSEQFLTMKGRSVMRTELEAEADFFQQLDQDVSDALSPTLKRLGIKKEWLDAEFEKVKKELIAKHS